MFQFLTKLDYLLRETFLGLQRGGWMNWAAVSTVTILLFLFGMSLQASWKLEGLLNQFGSQVEVSVYLAPGASVEKLMPLVAKLPEVAEVKKLAKEQAWALIASIQQFLANLLATGPDFIQFLASGTQPNLIQLFLLPLLLLSLGASVGLMGSLICSTSVCLTLGK